MDTPRLLVTSTDPFHFVIPTNLTLPLPPRLTPVEALEQVRQITPDCVPLHLRHGEGAELFAKAVGAGMVLLKWPDGVCVAAFAACIPPDVGLEMYFHGRDVLEAHAAPREGGAL